MQNLTVSQREKLTKLEALIAAGKIHFLSVGRALLTIRDERLYKATHNTFEDYCRERWEFRRRYADRLIQACQLGQDLSPAGTQKAEPETEREARKTIDENRLAELKRKALEGMNPEERSEAIKEEEEAIVRRSMPHVHGGQGRKERMSQIERIGKRFRALVEGLGDETGPIVKRFDSLMESIRRLPE